MMKNVATSQIVEDMLRDILASHGEPAHWRNIEAQNAPPESCAHRPRRVNASNFIAKDSSMTSAPLRAALYSNGKTPLFLDTAEITFTFADGPPITAQVQIALVDYKRNTATIAFYESDREAIEALSLGPHFHTTVAVGELCAAQTRRRSKSRF